VTQNFNKLIGRYPGADGFKTGFICASGYNLVASATRNGKRLIAVVLGSSSGNARAVRAAQILERGFGGGLGWLKPALGTVESLAPVDATPPNLREEMCGGKRKRPATDEDADVVAANGNASTGESPVTFFTAGLQPAAKPSDLIAAAPEPSEPIPVYTGPTKTGTALIAAVAADTEKQTPKRGKKSKIAAKKPDAAKPGAAKPKAEASAKPAAVRHASAKPEAAAKPAASAEKKPAAKPAAADKPAPKPAKPNAAAKPKGEKKPAG
jgi:D-alanyl-D-alanine carboxypeptidase